MRAIARRPKLGDILSAAAALQASLALVAAIVLLGSHPWLSAMLIAGALAISGAVVAAVGRSRRVRAAAINVLNAIESGDAQARAEAAKALGAETGETRGGFERIAETADADRRIRNAIDSTGLLIMIIDASYRIVYVNRSLQALLKSMEQDIAQQIPGFSCDRILNGSIDFFHGDAQRQRAVLDHLTAPHRATFKLGRCSFALMLSPVLDAAGRRVGTIAEWRDITDEARVQSAIDDVVGAAAKGDFSDRVDASGASEQLQSISSKLNSVLSAVEVALEKEKSLNALQRQFVCMVNHELRTPLAIIDGKARQIERRSRNAEEADRAYFAAATATVRRSVKRLIQLMETVLMAARLDEGRIEANLAPCGLSDLLKEIYESSAEHHTDRNFVLQAPDEVGEAVLDAVLIRQAVGNLVSNAVKYSDEGGTITISARRDPDEVVISVQDTGVGVPPEELNKLFDRFFRASTGEGRQGTGIGLHMVQQFVAMHEGRVEVASEVGVGSTFSIHLPDRPSRRPIADQASRLEATA